MENVKKVNNELVIAGQLTLEELQQAAAEGFKAMLNLRSPDEEGCLRNEQQQAEAIGLQYVNIPVKPNEISDQLTTEVLQQIDRLPKPALIHCASTLRAGAMAFMHIATWQRLILEQAFEQVHQIGFDCDAHPQMKQFFEHYVSEYSHAI